ncbi:MAG: hypothetical protein ACRCX2_34815 [Paraclostridium sp.]
MNTFISMGSGDSIIGKILGLACIIVLPIYIMFCIKSIICNTIKKYKNK